MSIFTMKPRARAMKVARCKKLDLDGESRRQAALVTDDQRRTYSEYMERGCTLAQAAWKTGISIGCAAILEMENMEAKRERHT